MIDRSAPTRRKPQAGPPLLVPAAAVLALSVASAACFAGGPRPHTSADATLDYLRDHQGVSATVAFLVFSASLPLAVLSGTVYRRLRQLGVTAPGSAIALAGGLLAAASLAGSGLILGVAGRAAPELDAGLARVLLDLSFASGGIGFAAPLALLVAGIAVPGLVLGLLPRWSAVVGLVVALAGALSTLGLLTESLYPLLPVTRFGGLVWLMVVGVLLPATRRQRAEQPASGASR